MSRDQDRLARVLHDRAQDVGGHPLDLDGVQDRARGIRRRRRAATALATAAVLAVALPAGLVAGDRLVGTRVDPANPGPTPAPTADAEPTPTPSPTEPTGTADPEGPETLSTLALPRGADAGIVYVRRSTLVTPEGEVPLSGRAGSILDAGRLGDGWYQVLGDGSGGWTLELLDAERRVTDQAAVTGDVAVSASSEVLAYATPEGRVFATNNAPADRVEFTRPRAGGNLTVVALAGADNCISAGDCQVFVDTEGPEPTTWQLEPGGAAVTPVQTPSTSFVSMADVTQDAGVLAGIESVDDYGSCSVVFHRATGDQWRTCDFRFGTLSPDGQMISASSAYADGIGDAELAVLDAGSGDVLWHVQRRSRGAAFYAEWAWEDAEHLLAVTWEKGVWSLVRIGPDGSAELAADQVAAGELDRPFTLSTQP